MCGGFLGLGKKPSVRIPTKKEQLQTPAQSATQRKTDTGSKVKIGTDNKRTSASKRKTTRESNASTTGVFI